MYISDSPADLLALLDLNFFNQSFAEPEQVQDYTKSEAERQRRVYVRLQFDGLEFLIPLTKSVANLSKNRNPDLQKCCYVIPSSTRPEAGIDFTKAILVQPNWILPVTQGIANSQEQLIIADIAKIDRAFGKFYKDFKKDLKKDRLQFNTKFRFTVLKEFKAQILPYC